MNLLKVGDAVTVTFPSEPEAIDAGKTVSARIHAVRPALQDFVYVVTWDREGRPIFRSIKSEWIPREAHSKSAPAKPLGFAFGASQKAPGKKR